MTPLSILRQLSALGILTLNKIDAAMDNKIDYAMDQLIDRLKASYAGAGRLYDIFGKVLSPRCKRRRSPEIS